MVTISSQNDSIKAFFFYNQNKNEDIHQFIVLINAIDLSPYDFKLYKIQFYSKTFQHPKNLSKKKMLVHLAPLILLETIKRVITPASVKSKTAKIQLFAVQTENEQSILWRRGEEKRSSKVVNYQK